MKCYRNPEGETLLLVGVGQGGRRRKLWKEAAAAMNLER